MTIEPATLILTALSFCVLMLVLHFMLFKPVLAVMHERRDKTEASRKARDASAEKLEQQNAEISARLEVIRKNERDSSEAEIEKAKTDISVALREYRDDQGNRLGEFRDTLSAERTELESELAEGLDSFAKALADRLVSDEY